MTIGKLTLHAHLDDDGSVEVDATVSGHGFSGTGSAWFNMDELRRFTSGLLQYPLDQPVYLAGGYWSETKPSRLKTITLSIHVYLIDGRGQLGIRVRGCQPCHTRDDPASDHTVELELLTVYNRLGRFSRDIRDVLDGNSESATIEEEVL